MNSSGKVLIIFLVITAILLVSLTAISLFFFQKETERRKSIEMTLKEEKVLKATLEEELAELKKQNFLLNDKIKESDERLSDLSDELELEKGLREEMKLETSSLEKEIEDIKTQKEEIANEIEKRIATHDQLTDELSTSQQKIKELEAQLEAEKERSQKLGQLYEQQQQEASKLEETNAELKAQVQVGGQINQGGANSVIGGGVELQEIVVNSATGAVDESVPDFFYEESISELNTVLSGKILSVDKETQFVIVDLGSQDGLSIGNILSVYRNDNYVGDIKVTRLQPDMSAADLVQPLSVRNIKKNDQVKSKQ